MCSFVVGGVLMNIDFLTVDELYKMHNENESELVDLMYSSLFEIKPIQEENQNLLEISKTDNKAKMFEAEFGVARKYIKLVNEPDKLILRAPYLDERENPDLHMQMFTNERNDVLPINNYFIYIFTRVIRHPFGLVEIEFIGQHITKNNNDFKHIRFEHKFRESEYLYFDFENNKYAQVDSEEIKRSRRKLQKGEPLDDDLLPATKIFLHREQLLKTGKLLLRDTGNVFLKMLIAIRNKRKNFGSSINERINYLNNYFAFLDALDLGLKIQLIFANISVREYEYLKLKAEEFREVIKLLKTLLTDDLVSLMLNSKKYGFDENKVKSDILSLHRDSAEDNLFSNVITPAFEEFRKFLTANTGSLDLEGYIGFNLAKWELYPNIAQVEKRRNLSAVSTNLGQERDHINNILKLEQKKNG